MMVSSGISTRRSLRNLTSLNSKFSQVQECSVQLTDLKSLAPHLQPLIIKLGKGRGEYPQIVSSINNGPVNEIFSPRKSKRSTLTRKEKEDESRKVEFLSNFGLMDKLTARDLDSKLHDPQRQVARWREIRKMAEKVFKKNRAQATKALRIRKAQSTLVMKTYLQVDRRLRHQNRSHHPAVLRIVSDPHPPMDTAEEEEDVVTSSELEPSVENIEPVNPNSGSEPTTKSTENVESHSVEKAVERIETPAVNSPAHTDKIFSDSLPLEDVGSLRGAPPLTTFENTEILEVILSSVTAYYEPDTSAQAPPTIECITID